MISLVATLALQGADPLLATLFADPPPALDCSVTLDVVSVDEGEEKRQVFRYDAPSDAWTYVSRNGEPPSAEQREKLAERRGEDERALPGGAYAEALERRELDWRWVSGGEGRAVYRAGTLPDGTVRTQGRDASSRMEALYEVEASRTPVLLSTTFRLKEPWKVPMIAKVRRFEATTRFAPAPEGSGAEGHRLPASERVAFDAHVMGKTERGTVETTYSGWACAAPAKLAAD